MHLVVLLQQTQSLVLHGKKAFAVYGIKRREGGSWLAPSGTRYTRSMVLPYWLSKWRTLAGFIKGGTLLMYTYKKYKGQVV